MSQRLVRPKINTNRIKLQVQRQREEQSQKEETSAEVLTDKYIDFLEPGETLEELLKEETPLEVIYDDVNNSENAIYTQITRQYGHLLDADEKTRNRSLPHVVAELISERKLNKEEKRYLFTRITNQYLGHGTLQPLWNDKKITEIMAQGPEDIWVEIDGKLFKTGPNGEIYKDIKFDSMETYMAYIKNLFSQTKRALDKQDCLENGELLDGSRITVNWPLVVRYPTFNIRKPPSTTTRYTSESFISTGAATTLMMEFLGYATQAYRNMLVLGATGSGKTTVVRILIEEHTTKDRLVYMEDARELNPKHPHFISLQTVDREKKPVDYGKLIKQSLRMRPDRIGIQEIRGGTEASAILKAIMAGHDGVITTAHAGTPQQIADLLVIWLKESGINVDDAYLNRMIHGALDILVFTERLEDGQRKITEVWEVLPWDGHGTGFKKIFYYDVYDKVHRQCGNVSKEFVHKCRKKGVILPEKFSVPLEGR